MGFVVVFLCLGLCKYFVWACVGVRLLDVRRAAMASAMGRPMGRARALVF